MIYLESYQTSRPSESFGNLQLNLSSRPNDLATWLHFGISSRNGSPTDTNLHRCFNRRVLPFLNFKAILGAVWDDLWESFRCENEHGIRTLSSVLPYLALPWSALPCSALPGLSLPCLAKRSVSENSFLARPCVLCTPNANF